MAFRLIIDMKSSYKYSFFLGFFYLISQGGILLIPNAIFWDDWVLFRTEPSVVFDIFKQSGSMFNLGGYLHIGLLKVGPWAYRFLTFILMFSSGLLLNTILKKHTVISEETRFFVVLLFLILPFNLARVALIDFPYALCYFFFFLAWVLMDRFRILALIIFFISFNTNSLLVFYAIPILDMLYRKSCLTNWRSEIKNGIRHFDYILLPFVYIFIKTCYYRPFGPYSGYNESNNVGNLLVGPVYQIGDLFRLKLSVGFIALFSFIVFYLFSGKKPIAFLSSRLSISLFLLGITTFILGVFPYYVLGKIPLFNGWDSRYQLLMPLGFSLIIVGAWYYLKGNIGVISVVVGMSLSINVCTYTEFFIDWQKQKELIQLFSNNDEIKNGSLIIITDQSEYLNAVGRKYRFYEWNGLFEMAFGNEKRFGISKKEIPNYLADDFKNYYIAQYKAETFRRDSTTPPINVEINVFKPKKNLERIIGLVFPKFSITVTKANLNDNR